MADDSKSPRGSKKKCSPVLHTNPQAAILKTTPSPLPFKLKNYNELCVADENLPSSHISELWKKPLKLATPLANSNSPNVQGSGGSGKKNERTPTSRRNFLPPTKLVFDQLDSDELTAHKKVPRSGYRRSMSFPERTSGESPTYNPKRLKLLNEENSPYEDIVRKNKSALKESNENVQYSPASSSTSLTPAVKKLFLKSQSDSILSSGIKSALEKIEGDPNLIGDASTSYILPIMLNGKHADLKEIEGKTLADFMEKKENHLDISYKIIDCRYPYEFAGGHIRGALNLYTKKQIQEELLDCKLTINSPAVSNQKNSREILIFHCEFSSKRGPILCRYLRHIDRTSNASTYPFLFYPELYVLFGGYKDFVKEFPLLCDPPGYVPMDHPEHADEYRRYKSESKLGV